MFDLFPKFNDLFQRAVITFHEPSLIFRNSPLQIIEYISEYTPSVFQITREDFKLFLCSMFLPRCNHETSQDIQQWSNLVPCRQFCMDVEEFVKENNLPYSYIFYLCPNYPAAVNASTKLCETKGTWCSFNVVIKKCVLMKYHSPSFSYSSSL